MADLVLLFLGHFSEGLVQRFIEEQRIIAEAARAALFLQQYAGAGAFRNQRLLPGILSASAQMNAQERSVLPFMRRSSSALFAASPLPSPAIMA